MAAGGVKVIEIQKTTARLEWIDGSNNGRPIMYYNILGRTNWNKTWVNVSEGVPAYEIDRYTGRKQAEITNLTPWSGYEFSVCAVNDLGIGTPSAPSPLYNTHTDKPYISPRNVGGGGGKIGDLTIKWTPLKSEEQNAHGIHYKIFWRLHARNTEWATEVLKQHGNTKMAVVHIPLDNYYTRYDVKVQAINDVGMGPESGVNIIYSAEDMPQVAPQQPIARGFNSTSLNVTWNAVELTREKIRGNLIGHRLKYWKKGFPEEDSVYYLSRTTRPWALIVGLQPDTYYFVKVMVYNAAGEGPESERYMGKWHLFYMTCHSIASFRNHVFHLQNERIAKLHKNHRHPFTFMALIRRPFAWYGGTLVLRWKKNPFKVSRCVSGKPIRICPEPMIQSSKLETNWNRTSTI